MKKTAIGHVRCPVCDFADAAVKEDKNEHAYVHCSDCNAQVFTRNDFRDGQLRKRMRPVTVTVTDTAQNDAPAPSAPPVAPAAQIPPKTAPRPAKAPPPAPPAPPAPAPVKKSWLTPLMAGGANG